MKWFKHDTTTSADPKIKLLKKRHGGIGVYIYFEINRLIAQAIESDNANSWCYLPTDYIKFPDLLAEEIATTEKLITEVLQTCIELQLLYKVGTDIVNPKILLRADRYFEKACKKKGINPEQKYNDILTLCTQSVHHVVTEGTQYPVRIEENRIEQTPPTPSRGSQPVTAKTALLACTDVELEEIATSLQVSTDSVRLVHQQILDAIADGTFQKKRYGQTVYYTLRKWVGMRLEDGKIKRDDAPVTSGLNVKKLAEYHL